MEYDKLIRDKIPEVIEARGESCITHISGDDEYRKKLRAKLSEEVEEFLKNPCVDELVDIEEVIRAIAKFEFGGKDELERERIIKVEKLGSFEKRIVLDEADDR